MRGRPAKWQRGPDGKYLKDRFGNYIPLDQNASGPAEPVQSATSSPPLKNRLGFSKAKPYEFASVGEFIQAADNLPVTCISNEGPAKMVRDVREASWFGLPETAGYGDIVELARRGWHDGAAKLFDMAEQIKVPAAEKITRKRVWADQGEEVCVDRLFAGEDQFWSGFAPARKPKGGKVLRMAINVSVLGHVEAEDMFWTGAAGLVLADILTKAGYLVGIDLARAAHNANQEHLYMKVALKQPDEPLSITGLASTVCLAGFFRTVGLHFTAKHWEKPCGMGVANSIRDWCPEGADIFLPSGSLTSRKAAIQWVNDKLAELA